MQKYRVFVVCFVILISFSFLASLCPQKTTYVNVSIFNHEENPIHVSVYDSYGWDYDYTIDPGSKEDFSIPTDGFFVIHNHDASSVWSYQGNTNISPREMTFDIGGTEPDGEWVDS